VTLASIAERYLKFLFYFPYFLEEKNTIFGSAPSAENYPFTPSEKTAKQIFSSIHMGEEAKWKSKFCDKFEIHSRNGIRGLVRGRRSASLRGCRD
jgi:hypothetical protein